MKYKLQDFDVMDDAEKYTKIVRKVNDVIDLGCRDYNDYDRYGKKAKITRVDKALSERKTVTGLNITNVKWDLDEFPYPFKSASFDKIQLYQVLAHLKHPEKVLEECKRILKPRGYISVHGCANECKYKINDHKYGTTDIVLVKMKEA